MKNLYPFISIIVPAYNAEKTIAMCIESLLRQDFPEGRIEIIVVDNNSSDGTRDVVSKYPVRLYEEKSIQSSYAARNKGIKASRGEILAFTDSDCEVRKDWLRELIQRFEDETVGCFVGEIHGLGTESPVQEYLLKLKVLWQKASLQKKPMSYAVTANVAYRRAVFDKIGLFDDCFISGGDVDFFWRMTLQTDYRYCYNPKAVVGHRFQVNVKEELYSRYYRYGGGVAMLMKKYPDFYSDSLVATNGVLHYAKLMKRGWKFLRRSLIRLAFYLLGYERRQGRLYLYEPFYEFITHVAFRQGRYRGLKNANTHGYVLEKKIS